MKMLKTVVAILTLGLVALSSAKHVDYTGHKVITVTPSSEVDLEFLHKLRTDYGVDLWNEPRIVGVGVMIHLRPEMISAIEEVLTKNGIEFEVAYYDLQSVIMSERILNAPSNISRAEDVVTVKYNQYNDIVRLLTFLSTKYPKIAKLETIGKSYENRSIYNIKISSGNSTTKPAIMIECGIHAREWSSVAACLYTVHQLINRYGIDSGITGLVDKYEFNVVVVSNPDGYIYTWTRDRLWRKTRSHSSADWKGACRGADANRNFDIEHCGVGSSHRPCDDFYCGDYPFSESEARALKDLMVTLGSRIKAYFSIHAYSQLWMTPYGIKKTLPPDYSEMERIAKAGVKALAARMHTQYKVGSIANITYEVSGSSVDYAYVKENVKIAFAIELRDTGRHGFFLPQNIIPAMCDETFDGLVGAIQAF